MAADLVNNIQAKAKKLTKGLVEQSRSDSVVNKFAFDLNNADSEIKQVKNLFERAGSVVSSDDMSNVVGMIKDGNQITIFTPSDTTRASFENDP